MLQREGVPRLTFAPARSAEDELKRANRHNLLLRRALCGAMAYGSIATIAAVVGWTR